MLPALLAPLVPLERQVPREPQARLAQPALPALLDPLVRPDLRAPLALTAPMALPDQQDPLEPQARDRKSVV